MLWSPTTRGFYAVELHGDAIPGDAVKISEAEHAALLDGQAAGLRIETAPDGAPVLAAPPLDDLKVARKAAAQAALAARIALGMPWADQTLQIDEASQGRLSAAVLMAQYGLPQGFAWRMADNSWLPVDAASLVTMARAAGAHVTALRAHYWGLADAIAAAPDAAAVEAVDLDAGWPLPASGTPDEPPA
jgi:hypothetical protein